MKLTAAVLSLVLAAFTLSACNRGPDDGKPSSAGSTADPAQSQQDKAPKRAPAPRP